MKEWRPDSLAAETEWFDRSSTWTCALMLETEATIATDETLTDSCQSLEVR